MQSDSVTELQTTSSGNQVENHTVYTLFHKGCKYARDGRRHINLPPWSETRSQTGLMWYDSSYLEQHVLWSGDFKSMWMPLLISAEEQVCLSLAVLPKHWFLLALFTGFCYLDLAMLSSFLSRPWKHDTVVRTIFTCSTRTENFL